MRLILPVVLMTCFGVPLWAQTEPTITVAGEGTVTAIPDMATVSIAIQTEAPLAADAMDQASAATANVLATLDTTDIAPADIQSGAIRLNPVYSSSVLSSGNEITGYRAVNAIDVRVRDLDVLGGLLADVVGDGANRLGGVRFGLQEPETYLDEARRAAVAEGARLAGLYAEAAGVPLGDLLRLDETGSGGYQPMRAEPVMLEMAASSPSFDVPVALGEITLRANVTMVYLIGE